MGSVAGAAAALALVVCSATDVAAQATGPAPALHRILVGDDPSSAVVSESQLSIIRHALAVDINSVPLQTASARVEDSERVTYGPVYLQHALPMGKNALDFVVLFQRAWWRSLDSLKLDEDALVNRVPELFGRPATESRASLEIASDTLGIGARYGVRADFDVALTVPVQRVCISGVRTVRIGPAEVGTTKAEGCGTGLGDVQVSGKYSRRAGPLFIAGNVGISLATGDVERLTGKGENQTALSILVSKRLGLIQPHLNLGATLGGHGIEFKSVDLFGAEALIVERVSVSRSFDYATGITVVHGSRATYSAEVVGRALRHGVVFRPFEMLGAASLELQPVEWQSKVFALFGAKISLADWGVVSGHVSRQLSSSGLRASMVAGASLTIVQRLSRHE